MAHPLQRRPSLIYDEYEESLLVPKKVDESKLNTFESSELSIDDMDMISLPTYFDEQMQRGSPMYMDDSDPLNDSMQDIKDLIHDLNYTSKPIPKEPLKFPLDQIEGNENVFQKIKHLRAKYIVSSFQDSASNIKYDIENWFLYPKPLPKYWRYDRDKRLQDSNPDLIDTEEPQYAVEQGYYFPIDDDRDFFATTVPVDENNKLYNRKVNWDIRYTGEYFDIDHYKKEYNSHVELHKSDNANWTENDIPDFKTFKRDFEFIINTVQSFKLNELSEKRLEYLLNKFDLFQHLKSKSEMIENKHVPYRDFYNCRKVDRNFLLSGCIQQHQICDFIWGKINEEPGRIIHVTKKGERISLIDIFKYGCSNNNNPAAIGLKVIDDEFLEWYKDIYLMNAHIFPSEDIKSHLEGKHVRFYLLAQTFLEYDNYIEGEYLAEMFIKYVVHNLESNKYLLTQISVDYKFYNPDDISWWNRFTNWIMKWNLVSYNVRWNVRIARIYTKLFNIGLVKNFQEFVDSIFDPLFKEENINNIELQFFLANLCSIDLLVENSDDHMWKKFTDVSTHPENWVAEGDNPPVAYYIYYIFKNLSKLNALRHKRNQNTITLRSGCSYLRNRTSQFGCDLYFTDQAESLVCNLLLCNGGLLQGQPVWTAPASLQYLFYLFQIPIIASPLSSVSNVLSNTNIYAPDYEEESFAVAYPSRDITITEQSTYGKNPYLKMFQQGMKMSLSCKSLLFNNSYTNEPIMEEYSVAASIYLLNAADLCELSRNSVISSGYDGWYKRHWIGVTTEPASFLRESVGFVDTWFDISEAEGYKGTSMRHNVPIIRRKYRDETLQQEWSFLDEQIE